MYKILDTFGKLSAEVRPPPFQNSKTKKSGMDRLAIRGGGQTLVVWPLTKHFFMYVFPKL